MIPSPSPPPTHHHNDVPHHVFRHVSGVFFIVTHVTQRTEPLALAKTCSEKFWDYLWESADSRRPDFPPKSSDLVIQSNLESTLRYRYFLALSV
jgi:hypothetical protein